MSDRPLGRDRLGRLVYDGDLGYLKRHEHYKAPIFYTVRPKGDTWTIRCGLDYDILPDSARDEFAVFLFSPPKRSNYERYFADLGTIDEVIKAFDLDQCDRACVECPYRHWGSVFGAEDELCGDCCVAFKAWLKQEATL